MQKPNRFAFAHTCFKWTAAASAAIGLSACANGPTAPAAPQSATTVTHNCKPQETVGFSCEMHDQRLLSLCASPGFEKFKGAPKNNPGYAYLAIGNPGGKVLQTFPENPVEYKKYMTTGVTLSGWPYVVVRTEKDHFFYANGNIEIPVTVVPESLPAGWKVAPTLTREDSYCAHRMHRENFDAVLLQLPSAMK